MLPRTASSRGLCAALAVLTCSLAMVGCKQFILLGYILGGPPSIEPEFEKAVGESFTDYEVTVAVVCFAPDELKWDFHAVDKELARYVTFKFVQHQIRVIDSEQVAAWMDKNPDWVSPTEIGAHFNCDYVVYVDLVKYSLYEESSQNLYRGRSEALVSCYKMDEDHVDGEEVFKKDVLSKYPTRMPRSTSEISYTAFKAEYLQRLSEEIGRLFYPHYLADDIGAAG